jgi:tol-pal system protein YbgF
MRVRAAEPAAAGGEAIVGVQPGGDAGGAEALYDVALQQHQRENLTAARRAFEDFIQQYANHPLATDARFYLADVLEQQGAAEEALDAFDRIPELHPNSSRVPDALYRSALLEIERGNRDEARRLLDRVVNTYPDSNVAGAAQERLRELR